MIRRPPRSTLFPSTPLSRSVHPLETSIAADPQGARLVLQHPRDAAAASRGCWRTRRDRKSTRLNSSHLVISYAVFCLKKKKHTPTPADPRPTPDTTRSPPAA